MESNIFKPGKKYMERALQLAANGAGFVSPNPMVGAVIVTPDGRIIGEGWHRRFGGPHAEVNAVNSVRKADAPLLPDSTIYVTLEPCSHYGKTPPCSKLLIEKRLRRVVIGSRDPFPLVSGRGVRMLREAGIEVIEDFMREECDRLNRRFITAHTLFRPYIQLKWAQSADGFMAAFGQDGSPQPVVLSNPLSLCAMHRERAMTDAILVGNNTARIDRPSLTVRHWAGRNPRPVTFGAPLDRDDRIALNPELSLADNMEWLYKEEKITSLMVEGGPTTLNNFIEADLADEIRVEYSAITVGCGLPAPSVPAGFRATAAADFENSRVVTYY